MEYFSKILRFARVIFVARVFVLNLSCELALLEPFVHKETFACYNQHGS